VATARDRIAEVNFILNDSEAESWRRVNENRLWLKVDAGLNEVHHL
jgi:hypothetical protein